MLSIMKRVFGPSTSYQEKIMYMTSLNLNNSIGSEKNAKSPICVDTILNLVTSTSTRYIGLQLLEIALQQNADYVYNKGNWALIIFQIIKDSTTAFVEKTLALKILTMSIPYIACDPSSVIRDELIKDVFPSILKSIHENVEWSYEAAVCIRMCLKCLASYLGPHQHQLLAVTLHQISCNVSSKTFEVIAECFCELPCCSKDNNADLYQERWKELYIRTLKTVDNLQFTCFSQICFNESYEVLENDLVPFTFKDSKDEDLITVFGKNSLRFINISKCLAKLLSVKSRYPVLIPVRETFKCLFQLYAFCKIERIQTSEEEIYSTFIIQMQIAGLAVLESLMLSCNLMKYTSQMKVLFQSATESSKSAITSELVSEFRVAIWKTLCLWIDGLGRSASKEICQAPNIIEGLLKDINIDDTESFQPANVVPAQNKSKKNTCLDSNYKNDVKRKNQQMVCQAALNTLESLLYTGKKYFLQGVFQELSKRIFKICQAVSSFHDPVPLPYNDDACREKLYSVVLTIIEVSDQHELQIIQSAMQILADINKDPSFKVRKICNKASVRYKSQFCPRRPLPVISFNNQRQPHISNESKYSEWVTDDFVENLPVDVSDTSGNVNIKLEQSFTSENEVEVQPEEYMDVEPHYAEQIRENERNGEDLLEIPNSSQCQDDVESEEEEEEEEEEEDERSYGDEEIQEEHLQEMYIPTNRKVKSPPPVQIKSDTVQGITDPEYEKLSPYIKIGENALNDSNADKHVNGKGNVICDTDMPSSASEATNENGIFGVYDEDDDEERALSPNEKNVENYDPPAKKQRMEIKEESELSDMKDNAKSPTIEQMKAVFVESLPDEDSKKEKAQLSNS